MVSIKKIQIMKTVVGYSFLCLARNSYATKMAVQISPNSNGQWVLYERGYSPGAGYITEDVALVPPQTLKLNSDGSLEATDYRVGRNTNIT